MSRSLENVTVVIVNYRTPDLTRKCLENLLRFYPSVNVILVDNGSFDESTEYIRREASQRWNVIAVLNKINAGHGAAMHQGIHLASTRYVLTLDSDCELLGGGLLEDMLGLFHDEKIYAVGTLGAVDRRGVDCPGGEPYHSPAVMMLDATVYSGLDPFVHHGAPCVLNFRSAIQAGYKLARCERILERVHHLGLGTRREMGIPDWTGLADAYPEDCKRPEAMLAGADPEIVK